MPATVARRVALPILRRSGAVVLLGISMALCAGCAPHFYNGKAAILNEPSGFEIIRKERSWGDCYSKLRKMPTVYQLEAERYTLTVSQGARYWPEFFLGVRSSEGIGLKLSGRHIIELGDFDSTMRQFLERRTSPTDETVRLTDIPYADSHTMRQFREARRTSPTHKTVRLTQIPFASLTVSILDDDDELIGEHVLNYTLVDVNCFEWDAI